MNRCRKCDKPDPQMFKRLYCSVECHKAAFYTRMQESKELRKKALEQEQLAAEFQSHPERYTPDVPPIIVKTEAEQKMDAAFAQLKEKLHGQTKQDRFEQTLQRLKEESQGL